jgi:hypothetical protein
MDSYHRDIKFYIYTLKKWYKYEDDYVAKIAKIAPLFIFIK